jgi:hypothetical protein
MGAFTCAPISDKLIEIYEMPPIVVHLCTLAFLGIHPFSAFFSNYLLDKYGLKLGVIKSIYLIK